MFFSSLVAKKLGLDFLLYEAPTERPVYIILDGEYLFKFLCLVFTSFLLSYVLKMAVSLPV